VLLPCGERPTARKPKRKSWFKSLCGC
jgi:hypothetical protein